jgi:hypothetical protein
LGGGAESGRQGQGGRDDQDREDGARGGSSAAAEGFIGRLLVQRDYPSAGGGEGVADSEVYLTRRGRFALWWSTSRGRRKIEHCKTLAELATALADHLWAGLHDEVLEALEREAVVEDC